MSHEAPPPAQPLTWDEIEVLRASDPGDELLPIWDQRPGETRAEAMARHGAEGTCPFCNDEECPW